MKKKSRKRKSKRRWLSLVFILLAISALVWYLYHCIKDEDGLQLPSHSAQLSILGSNRSPASPEIPLCEGMVVERWLSWKHRTVVECSIFAKAENNKKKELQTLVKNNDNQIKDQIRKTVASADLAQLTDPQLRVIKRRTLHEINSIVGEGKINKILIPEWHVGLP